MKNIKILTLSGGGPRAIAFVGAYKYMHENNLLKNLKVCYGTSAGALMSTAIAIGYTPDELFQLMKSTDFNQFLDGGGILRQTWNLFFSAGMNPGVKLRDFYDLVISNKLNYKNATFQDIETEKGICLHITATSLDTKSLVVYSSESSPRYIVADAIRASSSLPLVYFPVKSLNMSSGLLTDIQVDGGVCDDFVMDLQDKVLKDGVHTPEETSIGLEIMDVETPYSWNDYMQDRVALFKVVGRIINIFMQQICTLRLEQGLKHKTHRNIIQISSLGISTTDFNLTESQKNDLWQSGYDSAEKFFQNQ